MIEISDRLLPFMEDLDLEAHGPEERSALAGAAVGATPRILVWGARWDGNADWIPTVEATVD